MIEFYLNIKPQLPPATSKQEYDSGAYKAVAQLLNLGFNQSWQVLHHKQTLPMYSDSSSMSHRAFVNVYQCGCKQNKWPMD